jgi:hypothetical protein
MLVLVGCFLWDAFCVSAAKGHKIDGLATRRFHSS